MHPSHRPRIQRRRRPFHLSHLPSRDPLGHHDHLVLPRHGPRLRSRVARYPAAAPQGPETWHLLPRDHGRHASVRALDRRAVPGLLRARPLWLQRH